jgi:hypothetical protein
VRGWIKALPLGLGVPILIGMSSVKPEDAASNLAAWAQWAGIHDVPTWLNNPGIDRKVIAGTILIGAIYAFGVWGVPLIRKSRVFVPANVTPERLLSFFEENTAIIATELTKCYIGQWMTVTGALRNVSAFGQVSFERNRTPSTWFDYADILCYFREAKIDDLKSLRLGDRITVVGRISRIAKLS